MRRQEVVNTGWVQNARLIKSKMAIEDPGCINCEQGREIIKMVKKAAAEKPTERGKTIVLDFSDYPDAYQQISDMARDDFRSFEMQVMYFVITHMAGRAACKDIN